MENYERIEKVGEGTLISGALSPFPPASCLAPFITQLDVLLPLKVADKLNLERQGTYGTVYKCRQVSPEKQLSAVSAVGGRTDELD